ncbi:MAG: hypothetical protein SFZ03_10495 [Candidatus Melainabacteria bacterium]|nr:hypothetical protein [Candidatus Melainabacteria bacterium]
MRTSWIQIAQSLLSLALFGGWLWIVVSGWQQPVTVTLLEEPIHAIGFGQWWLLSGIAMGVTLLPVLYRIQQQTSRTVLASKRQQESAAVQTEIASDRVKALEAKIETLEVALQKALKSS